MPHPGEALDPRGAGRDWTAPAEVGMDDYTARIHEAIDRAPGPVVLVAHSRGGLATTQAAEGRHERIDTLVYLAAYLLRDGESVLDVAPGDTDSLVLPNLDLHPDGHWDMLRADAFRPALD